MLLLLAACTLHEKPDDSDTTVPVTCEPAPSAEWAGDLAYEDRTVDMGLADIRGGRMQAVDLDGDRYPDLLVSDVYSNARDDIDAGIRYHYVLMNREVGGQRTFVDESVESGLLTNRDGTTGVSTNVFVFGDVDGDGDLDAFAGRYVDEGAGDATGDCSEIYLNDGAGHFTMAEQTVCTEGMATSGASFTDADADGNLDLWVVAWYDEYGGSLSADQDQLFLGNGDGTFRDVTEDAGLQLTRGRSYDDFLSREVRRPAYGATACDVDGDTLPELIASNYGRAWNQLWHNDGGATFHEIGEEAHFDADTNLDYADNAFYACWYELYGTNDDPEPTVGCGDTSYADYWTDGYDDQPARLAGNTFTTSCADVDNDGDLDLFSAEIKHDWAGQSADGSQLLLNDGTGIFERIDNEENGLARSHARSWNEGDITSAIFDFDNDGWKDLLIGSSDYENTQVWLWRQVSPGQFEEVSDDTGMNHPWPAGLAIADFDLDGDLDFVTGSSTARSGTP